MINFEEEVINVSWHAEPAASADIIPFDGYASKFVSGHVELYSMIFLEKIQKIVEVFHANIFNAKVIYDEAKLDGTPFMAPETWCGGSFIETF